MSIQASCPSQEARRAVEEVMADGTYEYQSDFAKKYLAQGRAEGRAEGEATGAVREKARSVLTVLEARGLPVSEAVRARVIESRDLAELDLWLRRAVRVTSATAIFEGSA